VFPTGTTPRNFLIDEVGVLGGAARHLRGLVGVHAKPAALDQRALTLLRWGADHMAVSIRKLAPEEAQQVFPRRGQQDLSEYVAALRDLHPGEAAGIEREGFSDRAIKRRLGMAAKQLGYRLTWARRAEAEVLYFELIGTPPTQASGGRRRRRA
jgi:hypothetical protein